MSDLMTLAKRLRGEADKRGEMTPRRLLREVADRFEAIDKAWADIGRLITEHRVCDYDGETDEFEDAVALLRTAIEGTDHA